MEISNAAIQKITEGARKEKAYSGLRKLKEQLPFAWQLTKMTLHHRLSSENTKSLRAAFSKNTFGELLLMFQFFKQFNLTMFHFEVPEAFFS